MSAEDTIRILLARGGQAGELDPPDWQRTAARVAWVRETMAAGREAQRQMDHRCIAAAEHLDEDAFNRLFEAEQAKLDAIHAEIRAVIDHDRWPRGLHFKGI